MSLFDYITYKKNDLPIPARVKELYPDIKWDTVSFQTKDLVDCMTHYYIDTNGQLWYTAHNYEWVDDPGSIFKGYMESKSSEEIKATPTDYINFYDMLDSDDEKGVDIWLEFRMHLICGVVNTVECVKCEETPSITRITTHKEFNDQLKKRNEFSKSLLGKIYYAIAVPYNWLLYKCIKAVNLLINGLNWLVMKMYKGRM